MNHSVASGLLTGFAVTFVSALFIGEPLDPFMLGLGTAIFGLIAGLADWVVLKITHTGVLSDTSVADWAAWRPLSDEPPTRED